MSRQHPLRMEQREGLDWDSELATRPPRHCPSTTPVSRHSTRPDVLAFIYPNKSINHKATNHKATNHDSYLTSVNAIEAKTGLDFLLKLPEADQAVVESAKATAIWK